MIRKAQHANHFNQVLRNLGYILKPDVKYHYTYYLNNIQNEKTTYGRKMFLYMIPKKRIMGGINCEVCGKWVHINDVYQQVEIRVAEYTNTGAKITEGSASLYGHRGCLIKQRKQ